MFDKINAFLRDKENVKKISMAISVIFIVLLPLVYFGYVDNFDWQTLIAWEVGVLGVLSFVSIWTGRIKSGELSFDIEVDSNEPLKDVLKANEQMVADIYNIDLAMERLDIYNQQGQDRADKELTNTTLDKLRIKLKNLQRAKQTTRTKLKIKSLENKIANIVEFGLIDTTFVPLAYEDVIDKTATLFNLKKRAKKSRGKYNPKTDGKKFAVVKSLFSYTSIGANAGLLFAISDWKKVFTYYVMLLIVGTFTWALEFVNVKRKTAVHFLEDRQDINMALQYIHENTNVKKIVDIKNGSHAKPNEDEINQTINNTSEENENVVVGVAESVESKDTNALEELRRMWEAKE